MADKKLRQMEIQIKAPIQTKCVVRSTDDDEYIKEYAKNTFIDSMEAKGVYIDTDVGDIEITILPPKDQQKG